ncbi:MAG: hypothetical protein ABUT20_14680 [Bacteroidota bacterium]
MKLPLALSVLVLLAFSITNAQFKTLAEGVLFDEPEEGVAKIVQMKNGNTMFLHITPKSTINVQVYNATHKKKGEQSFQTSMGKDKFYVKAVFEISGDMVVIVETIEGRTPRLFRLIINGNTGVLKNELQIAELNRVSFGQGYSMAFGGVPVPDFYIRKDPASDNYALVMLNSFEGDRNRRIEIVYYGSDNKEMSRAYYNSPDEKYKYLNYLDMVVIGKERVAVVAYAYNTRASGGKESELVLASLEAGSKTVTLTELPFSKDLIITDAITRYNPVTKNIILVTAAKENKKSGAYSTYIAYINPIDKDVEYSNTIYPMQASEKSIELFGKKNAYSGMPQNLFINNDGGFSVVYETIEVTTHYGSMSVATSTSSELGNIAVSKFDALGKEVGSCLIPKSQNVFSSAIHPFYLSEREGTAQVLGKGNQFKSFAYLDGVEKSYILFNDIEENAEKIKKGKITTIQAVSDCDGFFYDISGNEVLPDRDFVFGKPASKRENNLALFSISDYDKKNNVYVTLKLEKEGRDKGVKIVWLQPQ